MTATTAGRVAPHDLEAERAVLGALLVEPDRFDEAAAVVGAGDFFRLAHRLVFLAMASLRMRAAPIDFITVRAELEQAGHLDEVSAAYLRRLDHGVPRTSNISYYASIVRDLGARRLASQSFRRAADCIDAEGVTTEATAPVRAVLDTQAPVSTTWVHEERVAVEMRRLRARRDAEQRIESENRGRLDVPEFAALDVHLGRPVVHQRERIAGWLGVGSRVIVSAQYKAGKTTLLDNLTRSLVDGQPFLGRDPVAVVTGTVVRIDAEMTQPQGVAWLRRQAIRHADRVVPVYLRGKVSTFDILNPAARARWVEQLRGVGTEVLMLDCLRPVLDALALDEHRDAGRFLVALDALASEAGIAELIVVHHMGHQGERARGDSRIRDWPDVEWRLVRESDEPASTRYLAAFGRDVEQPEQRLEFDPVSSHLTIAGGTRRDARAEAALGAVAELLVASPAAMSGRAIKQALAESSHGRDWIDAGLKAGVRMGRLVASSGRRNAKLYQLSKPECPPVSGECTPDSECECPDGYRHPDARTLTDGAGTDHPDGRTVGEVRRVNF